MQIGTGEPTESNATGRGVQAGLGRCHYFERKADVMRESIGRAHGQNCQRGGRISQDLNNVMDGAVATAGKDGIATSVDGAAGFFDSVVG